MERSRAFAIEGLDGTGKTTTAQLLAQRTGTKYFHWMNQNAFKKYRNVFDNAPASLRFLYFTAASCDTYVRVENLKKHGDVLVDRTILSTIAYHRALGIPDWLTNSIPSMIIDQIDHMLYFTATDQTRETRMQERREREGLPFTDADKKSLEIGQRVDEEYRKIIPERTILVDTNERTPIEIVDDLEGIIFYSSYKSEQHTQ